MVPSTIVKHQALRLTVDVYSLHFLGKQLVYTYRIYTRKYRKKMLDHTQATLTYQWERVNFATCRTNEKSVSDSCFILKSGQQCVNYGLYIVNTCMLLLMYNNKPGIIRPVRFGESRAYTDP